MKTIAILYSTVDGQTKKICECLADHLQQPNSKICLYSIDHFNEDISRFDTIVIGASIRYGKHNEVVGKFIKENQHELEKINSAFFSVNLVARKADKNLPETNPYLVKFMESIDWKPDLPGVFAGSLDYKKYKFFDRLMIKAIMKFTNGPTKTTAPIEYTNWERVKKFADDINSLEIKPRSNSLKKTTA